eukprot:TRINITY_DN59952_c0_g1_i1.p1 TRINITY_DN59952_c0_g1~~TRINITY_DN59952_c0_g1_i1.p1  ORF type:complete len:125 (-),score=25.83 TRINITY_DN59952_c0_g1_i1:83-457(-)
MDVLVIQTPSTECLHNSEFDHHRELVEEAKSQGLKHMDIEFSHNDLKYDAASLDKQPESFVERYQELAKTNRMWLSISGIREKGASGFGTVYDVHMIIDAHGNMVDRIYTISKQMGQSREFVFF